MPRAANKAALHRWLQTALELELATIPPYMVALLSIQLLGNREPAELIRGVMIEEMLHLALVANLMNAVGAKPRLDRRAIPAYPLQLRFEGKPFADRQFSIDLAPFSGPTMKTFLQIELPRQPARAEFLELKIAVPAPTIGEFYSRIENLLESLDARGGLFTGDPDRQILEDYYWSGGGRIVPVHDLASAKDALGLVIAQGEGAWPPPDAKAARFGAPFQMGHYYRFNEIVVGHRYTEKDDPTGPPTGDSIMVDYAAVYPVTINPKARDYAAGSLLATLNADFNRRYTAMLLEVQEAMNGTPKSLYTAIMDSMHELTPLAHQMMKTPVSDAVGARTGCPSFEWLDR